MFGCRLTLKPNILKDIFTEQILRLNPHVQDRSQVERLLQDIKLELDYDDLGRKFFKRLKGVNSEIKLINFDNFNDNVFHVTTELTCKNGHEVIAVVFLKKDSSERKISTLYVKPDY